MVTRDQQFGSPHWTTPTDGGMKVNKGYMDRNMPTLALLFHLTINAFPLPLSDPPTWCSGPAGWRVLVSPGNRPLICREAVCRARQPSKILPIKAASWGSWLLYHSLRWKGIHQFFFEHLPYQSSFPCTRQMPSQKCPLPSVMSLRWIIRQMIGWWRTWIHWMTMWHLYYTSRQIILYQNFGRKVGLICCHAQ